VFHPCSQRGPGLDPRNDAPEISDCEWVDDTDDEYAGSPDGFEAYDVGVVWKWAPDPDFADLGVIRVWFVGSSGSLLYYSSTNLWTPKLSREAT
jgi:hypothetical protein